MRVTQEWIQDVIELSATASPFELTLPSCEQLLDPALPDNDRHILENNVCQSLDEQCPWLQPTGQTSSPTAEDTETFAGVIRWLQISIADWSPSDTNLIALVLTIGHIARNNRLLQTLPDTFIQNPAFIKEISSIISHITSAYIPCLGFSRNEAQLRISELDQALTDNNWNYINDNYIYLESIIPSTLTTSCINILNRWNSCALTDACNNIHNIFRAYTIISVLDQHSTLNLASKTTSNTMRFACVYGKLHQPHHDLSEAEVTLLSNAFIAASKCAKTWKGWMAIFNRYPSRFPTIQSSLGKALAKMPDESIFTYIDTLELSAFNNEVRKLVTTCLSQFKSIASKEKRSVAWQYAYSQWDKWSFGKNHSESSLLMKISRSTLDYALVGFYLECKTSKEREEIIQNLVGHLSKIGNLWHSSKMDCTAVWCHIQSTLQPVIHAENVAKTQCDWISETSSVTSPINDPGRYFYRKYLGSP